MVLKLTKKLDDIVCKQYTPRFQALGKSLINILDNKELKFDPCGTPKTE